MSSLAFNSNKFSAALPMPFPFLCPTCSKLCLSEKSAIYRSSGNPHKMFKVKMEERERAYYNSSGEGRGCLILTDSWSKMEDSKSKTGSPRGILK